MIVISLISMVVALASQPGPRVAEPPPVTRHWGAFFISPMGEPFRTDRGGDAMALWFAQVDRNHDGYITLDEMQADADRFFATLDTNHDGEIDPDEINHYEDVIAPEIRSSPLLNLSNSLKSGGHRGHGGKEGQSSAWREPREGDNHEGAARFGLLDLPEPVVSADADFNRGVSKQEFRQAAVQRFVALDLAHHGRISLAEFELMRPPPAAGPKKPEGEGDIDTESVP